MGKGNLKEKEFHQEKNVAEVLSWILSSIIAGNRVNNFGCLKNDRRYKDLFFY